MPGTKIGMTLAQHVYDMQSQHAGSTGVLTGVLNQISLAAKIVSREVRKAGLVDVLGLTGETNVQGEEVRKLDDFANEIFMAAFSQLGHFCIMASEELVDPVPISDGGAVAKYTIAFDPLDGSSNIDANVSVGTIFAVHHRLSEGGEGKPEDLLQPGRKLAAAGYVLYGSSTMLVLSTGHGVYGFTLDPSVGEFLESHHRIRIPEKGKIYSCNEGNFPYWSEGVRSYVKYAKAADPESGRPYTARYIGSMVADIHRTLLYGGIFMYPADTKGPKKPGGKLRLLYECSPMGYLMEQAGGMASDGRTPILDIQPEKIHQRTAFFAGSRENMLELHEHIARYDPI